LPRSYYLSVLLLLLCIRCKTKMCLSQINHIVFAHFFLYEFYEAAHFFSINFSLKKNNRLAAKLFFLNMKKYNNKFCYSRPEIGLSIEYFNSFDGEKKTEVIFLFIRLFL
jgi:hypothetical protein